MAIAMLVLLLLSANDEPTWLGLRLKNSVERNCVIIDVAAGPARGRLVSGDCVVSLNGQPARRAEDLMRIASKLKQPAIAKFQLDDDRVVEVVPSVRPKNAEQVLCEAVREVRTDVTIVRGERCDSISKLSLAPHATLGDLVDRVGEQTAAPLVLVGAPRCGEGVRTIASPNREQQLWVNSMVYFCRSTRQSPPKR